MKIQQEYVDLHAALERSTRIAEGCCFAFSLAGHYGMAGFALYEAGERRDMAMQVGQHLVSHEIPMVLPALPASLCEYPNPDAALQAICDADMDAEKAVDMLYDASIKAGESPYFIIGLRKKMAKEKNEIKDIKMHLSQVKNQDEKLIFNGTLLEKYENKYE